MSGGEVFTRTVILLSPKNIFSLEEIPIIRSPSGVNKIDNHIWDCSGSCGLKNSQIHYREIVKGLTLCFADPHQGASESNYKMILNCPTKRHPLHEVDVYGGHDEIRARGPIYIVKMVHIDGQSMAHYRFLDCTESDLILAKNKIYPAPESKEEAPSKKPQPSKKKTKKSAWWKWKPSH